MTVPHPINQAVISQALHDVLNGQMHRCKSMGFSAKVLAALQHPALVSAMANAKVPWCRVTINAGLLENIVLRAYDVFHQSEVIERMLRLGASTEMLSQFQGLTHQEVATRRVAAGIPLRKGRWPVMTEAQDAALWERWRAGLRERKIELRDDAGMLSLAMDLAEESSIPLAVVWGAILSWIDQGLT